MKTYLKPELEIDLFDEEVLCDIVVTSDDNPEIEWFRPEEEDE